MAQRRGCAACAGCARVARAPLRGRVYARAGMCPRKGFGLHSLHTVAAQRLRRFCPAQMPAQMPAQPAQTTPPGDPNHYLFLQTKRKGDWRARATVRHGSDVCGIHVRHGMRRVLRCASCAGRAGVARAHLRRRARPPARLHAPVRGKMAHMPHRQRYQRFDTARDTAQDASHTAQIWLLPHSHGGNQYSNSKGNHAWSSAW